MDLELKTIIWRQFGAAIDSLEGAMLVCPESVWGDRSRNPEFWYTAYHTLFWLDYYLTEDPHGFVPPSPFTLEELDPAGIIPSRVYSKEELHSYLRHGREKCRTRILEFSDRQVQAHYSFGSIEGTFEEQLLYGMRHVQHHAAQLNLILRQTTDSASPWVSRTKHPLSGN
jgi:hypothetical protein